VYEDSHIRSSAQKERDTFAFLCMGGEGPGMDKSVLVNSVHCTGDMLELASKLHKERGANVHVFALEHRYYGKSYPTFEDGSSPVKNENLVYLSSRQAIRDVGHFVPFATNKHLNSSVVPWVTFGGSYPGMLAAWARLQLPHLIHAAVSNSAPVEATVDMFQYNNYVTQILQDETVGGSQQCFNVIQEGHEAIGSIIQKSFFNGSKHYLGLERIAKLFNICDGKESLKNINNVQNFLSESVIEIPMQSNDPSCKEQNCNIEKLCQTILEKRSKMSALDVLAEIRLAQNGEDCDDIVWEKQLDYLSSPVAQKGGLRSWLWQTCNEFGFYQTCQKSSQCPFARGFHNLNQDFEICQTAFNVSSDEVKSNAHDTLELYKGWDMQTNRVFNVNGDIDPWSTLAITKDHGTQNLPNYMVKGASHHFWTHEVKESDSESVNTAREKIHEQVTAWLNEDALVTVSAKE